MQPQIHPLQIQIDKIQFLADKLLGKDGDFALVLSNFIVEVVKLLIITVNSTSEYLKNDALKNLVLDFIKEEMKNNVI